MFVPTLENGVVVTGDKSINFIYTDDGQLLDKDTGKYFAYNDDNLLVEADAPGVEWDFTELALSAKPQLVACYSGHDQVWILGSNRTCEQGEPEYIHFTAVLPEDVEDPTKKDESKDDTNDNGHPGYYNSTTTVPGPVEYTTIIEECPVCPDGKNTKTILVPPGTTDKGPNDKTELVPPITTDKGPNEGKTETVPGPIQYTTTTIECPVCEGGFSTTTIPVPPEHTDKNPPQEGHEDRTELVPPITTDKVPPPQEEHEDKTELVPPITTDKFPPKNEPENKTELVPPITTDKAPPKQEPENKTELVPPITTDKVPPPAPTTLADVSRQPESSSTGVVVPPQVEEANGAAKFGVGAAAAVAAMAIIV